eukprot:CAMPEP_0171663190 /NCGR_PEP_ID=MMETSP0990-20121206/46026_1 /TAXON_ID=483369 /ORGANISM="non described non described, Strain CCMP2098" /LENGTH=62 /DNA_ID=CAMNT_0012245801 /DNA_START=219 /DNA_END=407 /DNA_ORIENTATION=-
MRSEEPAVAEEPSRGATKQQASKAVTPAREEEHDPRGHEGKREGLAPAQLITQVAHEGCRTG